MGKEIKIYREDILSQIYFITCLVQHQKGSGMHGELSSKSDLMGGIFDRFINVIPEAIAFNKEILKDISDKKEIKVVSDFYMYEATKAGVNSDLIGISVDGKIIPFVTFNNGWEKVEGTPQIEVKTFKKNQKMISLRNQGYDDKFLVIIESDFRVDYLVPFLNKNIFNEINYDSLRMNDNVFIKNDDLNLLKHFERVDTSSNEIGSIKILGIFQGKEFMENSTLCEKNVSIQSIKEINEYKGNKYKNEKGKILSKYVDRLSNSLLRFNKNWYSGINEEGISYFSKNKKKFYVRCLDFECSDPDKIIIIKRNENNLYIKLKEIVSFNKKILEKDKMYKIELNTLLREENKGEEYFFQKDLLNYIPSKEELLKESIRKIIK